MKNSNPDCPCGSGARYAACCRPFHQGAEPPDVVRLMRSRYAAYALGEVDYLWKTLDPEHPDRARPEAEVKRDLRSFRQTVRFARLRVLANDAPEPGVRERVLFHAELYAKGKEHSFAELSTFRNRGDAWRYQSGITREVRAADAETLTLAGFDEG